MTPPLAGVRVLELANFMAGPYCGLLLADLGADVIKIENPAGGDFSRATPPFVRGVSAGFLALNRNKRSLALDLKHPTGREVFLRLAQRVDVVLENFRPGTMQDLGIDYPAVRALNPGVVYCSVSGYGQTGPYHQRPGLDPIMQGMSGIMSITGEADRPPVKVGVPLADLTAALFAASAIRAALLARARSGEGQLVDVSLLDRGFLLDLPHPSGGTVRATGSPIRFSQTPVRLERAGPLLGEHDDDVLAEIGLTCAERSALRDAHITGPAPTAVRAPVQSQRR